MSNSIEVGDKIVITTDPRRLTGTIVEIASNPDLKLKVKFDDYLIPPEMWYKLKDLELLIPKTSESDCDCGVKFCRDGGKHSDWCKTVIKSLPKGKAN
jgi:hypothetical protein